MSVVTRGRTVSSPYCSEEALRVQWAVWVLRIKAALWSSDVKEAALAHSCFLHVKSSCAAHF